RLENVALAPAVSPTPAARRQPKISESSSAGRFRDQFLKPLQARLFLLRTHYPPAHHLAVGWRLSLEELPGFLIPSQQARVCLGQILAALFVGINARLVFAARRKGRQPRRLHPFLVSQHFNALDIDRAP